MTFSITKHNDLITSAYRLSLTEIQIILYGISLVNPTNNKFPRSYEIDIKRFGEMFNRKHSEIYNDVKEAIMKRFWEREFTFQDKYETNKQGELVRARVKWVTTVKYSDKAGFIKIYFNPEIEDYLHNLKNNFTSYYIDQICKFKRFYSVRFYELAIMNLNKSKRNEATFKISIDDIRDIFELKEKYPRFCDLKAGVIDPSINEINKLSDIIMRVKISRTGRSPEAIVFTVKSTNSKELKESQKMVKAQQFDSKRVSSKAIELAKNLVSISHTGWDVYVIEEQFYSFMKTKGVPDNIDGAFIGFVKKKVVKPPG